jgi:hypothetical protein
LKMNLQEEQLIESQMVLTMFIGCIFMTIMYILILIK